MSVEVPGIALAQLINTTSSWSKIFASNWRKYWSVNGRLKSTFAGKFNRDAWDSVLMNSADVIDIRVESVVVYGTKWLLYVLSRTNPILLTLFVDNCMDEKSALFIWDIDGVPDDVVADILLAIGKPESWLWADGLFLALEFDDVDVILQTDTAFLRYLRSRRVVPLVIPTS